MTRPLGYRGVGERLWNSFSQLVGRGFMLYQSVSKCHSHILPFAAVHVCPDIYKIGPCEVKLLQVKVVCILAPHTHVSSIWEEIKPCPEWLWHCASIKCRFVHLQLPVVALHETIEWEDFVSVWLHQLGFNETARGVQVQTGQWTDIEVLIRPGSQESLTWRLFVGLNCWSTVIAFPSVSHMDVLPIPPSHSPSSSAGWDHRYSHSSWCSNMEARTEGRTRQRSLWLTGIFSYITGSCSRDGQFKNTRSFISLLVFCIILTNYYLFLFLEKIQQSAGKRRREDVTWILHIEDWFAWQERCDCVGVDT